VLSVRRFAEQKLKLHEYTTNRRCFHRRGFVVEVAGAWKCWK